MIEVLEELKMTVVYPSGSIEDQDDQWPLWPSDNRDQADLEPA